MRTIARSSSQQNATKPDASALRLIAAGRARRWRGGVLAIAVTLGSATMKRDRRRNDLLRKCRP